MNSVALFWPAAYNVVCEFLGANWYALVASAGLAALFIIHIIYALWLTVQNRRARGNDRYDINGKAPHVEWSSKNMLVLGIVVCAFLIVHLIQFWAKMQLVEVMGEHGTVPPAAGTLFIQEAFSQIWTPIVYIIGFIALWFHMNHGFWSMFQTIGWDSTAWIPRWKKIGAWWTSIVIALFIIQAVVFTVQSQKNYYSTEPELKSQYIGMMTNQMSEVFGPAFPIMVEANGGEQFLYQLSQGICAQPHQLGMFAMQTNADPEKVGHMMLSLANFLNYINEGNSQMPKLDTKQLEEVVANGVPAAQPQMMMGAPMPAEAQQAPAEAQQMPAEAAPSPEQQAADEAPAEEPAPKANNK